MKRPRWATRFLRITGASIVTLAVAASAFGQAKKPRESGYVGIDTCTTCHEEIAAAFRSSSHWAAAKLKLPTAEAVGCESCHGSGKIHSEDTDQPVFTFKKEPARERSARCLTCHGLRKESNFRHSAHERGGISCEVCHASGHSSPGPAGPRLLAQPERRLCVTCHAEQKAQMELPFRHRVADAPMRCSDCHDAHGKPARRTRRLAQEESCYRCHTDKQGPFVFEHQASTVTGCVACHQPHGSTNPRLLVRSDVRFLCLECHTETSAFHDLGKARFQNCTVCHGAIHGSHVDRKFLR